MGSEDRCPCKHFKHSEFQKVIDLRDVGLTVYRHVQQNRRHEDPTQILLEIKSSDNDVYILQNKNDFALTSADFVPVFENKKTSCLRCLNIVEHTRKVLQSVSVIGKNAVRGICNHCRTRPQIRTCQKCEDAVKKFAVIKGQPLFYDKDTSTHVNVWLRKVQFLLENVAAERKSLQTNIVKGQICGLKKYKSDIAITLDVNNTKISQFFTSQDDNETHNVPLTKSYSDGSIVYGARKTYSSMQLSKANGTYESYQSSKVYIPNVEQNASKLVDQNKFKFLFPSSDKEEKIIPGRSNSILLKTSAQDEFDEEDTRIKIKEKQLQRLHEGNTGIKEETKINEIRKKDTKKHKDTKKQITHTLSRMIESQDKTKKLNQPIEKSPIKEKLEKKARPNDIKEKNTLEGAKIQENDSKYAKTTRGYMPKQQIKMLTSDHQDQQHKNSKNTVESQNNDHLLDKNQKKGKPKLETMEKSLITKKELKVQTGITNKDSQNSGKVIMEKKYNVKENKAKIEKSAPTEKIRNTRTYDVNSKYLRTDLETLRQEKIRNKKDDSNKKDSRAHLEKSSTGSIIKNKKDTTEKKGKLADYTHKEITSMTNIEQKLAREHHEAKRIKSNKLKSTSESHIMYEDIKGGIGNKKTPKRGHDKVEGKHTKVYSELCENARIGLSLPNKERLPKKTNNVKSNYIKEEPQTEKKKLFVTKSQKTAIVSNKKLGKQLENKTIINEQSGNKLKRVVSSDKRDLELLKTFLHHVLEGNTEDSKNQNKQELLTPQMIKKLPVVAKHLSHKRHKPDCIICDDSDVNIDFEEWQARREPTLPSEYKYIKGTRIYKTKHREDLFKSPDEMENKSDVKEPALLKLAFKIQKKDLQDFGKTQEKYNENIHNKTAQRGNNTVQNNDVQRCGTIKYCLSDRQFIEKGWTLLPVEKYFRREYIYSMRPAYPELNWFKQNKSIGYFMYSTGEKLAEINENGCGRWYYKNGRLALDYYDSEDLNAKQRIVIYSSGELDQRGRSYPVTVLGSFDYSGNGIVFDHTGKIRLKYNQTEGVILDRKIGPLSRWKWHSLYENPPVLQRVMMDTHLNDPKIREIGDGNDDDDHRDKKTLRNVDDDFPKELDGNKINERLGKLYVPYQIKTKAFKINDQFSLRIMDQTKILILFGDGPNRLKFNMGMILNHEEIVGIEKVDADQV